MELDPETIKYGPRIGIEIFAYDAESSKSQETSFLDVHRKSEVEMFAKKELQGGRIHCRNEMEEMHDVLGVLGK